MLAAVLSLWLLSGASLAQATGELVGTWVFNEGGRELELLFRADGTGTMARQPIQWSAANGVLVLNNQGQKFEYRYQLVGADLTISGADLPQPVTFRRKTPPVAPGGIGGGIGGGIDKDGPRPIEPPLPLPRPPADDPLGKRGQPPLPAGNPEVAMLLGKWRDTDGKIVDIRADGTIDFGGETARYTVAGDKLTLIGGQGQLEITFKFLDNDRLQVTAQGETAVLTRVHDGLPQPPLPEPAKPDPGLPRGGDLPAPPMPDENAPLDPKTMLVGTWKDGAGDLIGFGLDGRYHWQGQVFQYAVTGDTLSVKGPGGAVQMKFRFETPDRLSVEVNGMRDTLTRVSKDPPGAAPAGLPDGAMPGAAGGVPGAIQPAPANLDFRKQIVGTWRDSVGGQMTFTADGKASWMGVEMTYTIDERQISIAGPGGAVAIQYRFESPDRIAISANGQSDTLTRVR
jgi:hypothetical protein